MAAQAGPADVVVDFDVIAQELGSPSMHGHSPRVVTLASRRRALLVRELVLYPVEGTAWLIFTWEKQAYKLGVPRDAPVTVVNPGRAVCLERARAAGRSESVMRVIRGWSSGRRVRRRVPLPSRSW